MDRYINVTPLIYRQVIQDDFLDGQNVANKLTHSLIERPLVQFNIGDGGVDSLVFVHLVMVVTI
jgi:hypothetical protein